MKFLSLDEVAEILHTSRRAVISYYKKKGLPAYKVGMKILFIEAEVQDWVKSRQIEPTVAARRSAGKKILKMYNPNRNSPGTRHPNKGGDHV